MYDPVQYGQYDLHPEVMAASIRSTQRNCASCARDGGRTATAPPGLTIPPNGGILGCVTSETRGFMSENSLLFSYAGHYRGSAPVPRHSHRGTELVLVIAGSCVTEFDGGVSLAARPGTVYITPPELAHTQNNTPDCETLYAVMELSGPGFDNRLRSVETGDDPVLRQWFAQLQLLNRDYLLDQASALLLAVWARLRHFEARSDRARTLHPGLQTAVDYIERHYMDDFSISELAARSGVSQSHLNALFRRAFGTGAQSYLTAARMRCARRLLLNPYYNIADVAQHAGFREANYFTRLFRRFHGVTPGEYRRNPSASADRARMEPQLNAAAVSGTPSAPANGGGGRTPSATS